MNDADIPKLKLDPKDVLYPSEGYDIALIGLSMENKLRLNPYLKKYNNRCFNIS